MQESIGQRAAKLWSVKLLRMIQDTISWVSNLGRLRTVGTGPSGRSFLDTDPTLTADNFAAR